MGGWLAALLKAILSFLVSLVARPAGAREAEDAPDQDRINAEIDALPPLPERRRKED